MTGWGSIPTILLYSYAIPGCRTSMRSTPKPREDEREPPWASSDPGSRIVSQSCDVLGGRAPEETAVFSAKVRSAQIAHALTRSTPVHHRRQHQTPGLLQSQRLLILQRAHRGD